MPRSGRSVSNGQESGERAKKSENRQSGGIMRILIVWESGEVRAELDDTPTARKIIEALPYESRASTWGDEVYFSLPVVTTLEENAHDVVDPGTVCFWVEGSSLAIPFGPTPASRGDECRLVTKVNIVGTIVGDPKELASIRDGDPVRVEAVSHEL